MNKDFVSISTCIFNRAPVEKLDECLANLAAAGFRHVELCCAPERLAPMIAAVKKNRLQVIAVHGVMSSDCVAEKPELRAAAIERAVKFAENCAEFCPCPIVEHYFHRFNNPIYGERLRDSVRELADKITPLGFTVCIETAPYKPGINERYPDSREIAGFVRSFQREDIRLIIDFNHSNLHENLAEVAKNTAGLVRHVHISNNRGGWEDHLEPQHPEGVIDIAAMFRDIRRYGYTGPANLEVKAPDFVPDTDYLREIRLYMEKILGFV